MDARARLRAYLEQRRELGEDEYVLDSMSVEQALSALGALQTGAVAPRQRVPALREPGTGGSAADRPGIPPNIPTQASTEEAPAPSPPPQAAPDVRLETAPEEPMVARKLPEGLVVGQPNGTLFEENPFADVSSITALAKVIEECTRCPLYRTATHAVPGDGRKGAGLMCVGEAPGATEDETGHPFVGAAGQLLTKILGAIQLTRDDVFIANVLKHRPPGNRNPTPDEVRACSPYLLRQIEIVRPRVILALGTFAAQTLLDTKTPIGKLRGMVHRYFGVPLIVTYHPAALLRNPAWKRPTWEDVQLARRVLDSPHR